MSERAARTPVRGLLASPAARLLLLGTLLPLVAAALGWVATQAFDPASWPIRSVRIDGELQRVDRARLQREVAPLATTGLLLVDVAGVRRQVEAMPWVDRAYVRRWWPDQLLVTVIEQAPFARWGNDRLLNGAGEVFDVPGNELPEGLAELVGPEGQQRRLAEQYRLFDSMLGRAGRKIRRLELDGRRAWHIELDNHLLVELGRDHDRQRLGRLLGVLLNWPPQDLERVERIDLRYTNGLAIRWRTPGNERDSEALEAGPEKRFTGTGGNDRA